MDFYDQVTERLKLTNSDIEQGDGPLAKIEAFSCFEGQNDELVVNVYFVMPDPPEGADDWDAYIQDQLCGLARLRLDGVGYPTCWFRTRDEFDDDQESDWIFIDQVPVDG